MHLISNFLGFQNSSLEFVKQDVFNNAQLTIKDLSDIRYLLNCMGGWDFSKMHVQQADYMHI